MIKNISIKNCNNINVGDFTIKEKKLNIKYGINGTGKSTIAKALEAFIEDDEEQIRFLLPFIYEGEFEGNEPSLNGHENFKNVIVFNEEYVNNYVFQSSELIKNSFEIFIKTDGYEKVEEQISELLLEINKSFIEHPELDELIEVYGSFINSFGKAKSGFSAAGALAKGIGSGNKLEHIPKGLEDYSTYLRDKSNVQWVKWQLDGKKYLDMADQCPYCTNKLEDRTKKTILQVSEEYDANYIKHLNHLLEIFERLTPYFSDTTADKIHSISMNVSKINEQQKEYLIEIKSQVESLLMQLNQLKSIGFHSLKNAERISDELKEYRIDLKYYSHLNSALSKEKTEIINSSLDAVLEQAGQLQGKINIQKNNIKNTIDEYKEEINDFLFYAGYKYEVSVEYDDDKNYHLVLKHIDNTNNISSVNLHLSYGERNAFALVLFMYDALRKNPDLIILDDPISSFDGNKKFAILNMLFMGNKCFKNKTVLLLTHEFGTVIDCVKTMAHKLSLGPIAHFLKTVDGILTEKEITKSDIKSFVDIANSAMASDIDSLNKLVYFRRLEEVKGNKSNAWELCSNIFHKRKEPVLILGNNKQRIMSEKEIEEATEEIKKSIKDFDYDIEFKKTQNINCLINLYRKSKSNYEKLQLYRIMFNENHENDVIRKFINETFHIENDYLFQLDPREYETIPSYIIKECDLEISEKFGE